MDKNAKKNTGIGIFFLGFSILYLLGTSTIVTFSPFGNRGLDSRSVPQAIGILAVALSSLHIVLTYLKAKRKPSPTCGSDPCDVPNAHDAERHRRNFLLFLSLFLLGLYSALFQKLGFILSTVLFLFWETVLLTPRGKVRGSLPLIVAFSIAVPVVVYVIFTKYLTLFLPKGILG